MKFSKRKMVERLTKLGLASNIDADAEAIMDDLDGQKVDENCWQRVVNGEPVYWCVGKSGKGYPVNENDCY